METGKRQFIRGLPGMRKKFGSQRQHRWHAKYEKHAQACLNANHNLSKDCERNTARANARLYLANIRRILKFC